MRNVKKPEPFESLFGDSVQRRQSRTRQLIGHTDLSSDTNFATAGPPGGEGGCNPPAVVWQAVHFITTVTEF